MYIKVSPCLLPLRLPRASVAAVAAQMASIFVLPSSSLFRSTRVHAAVRAHAIDAHPGCIAVSRDITRDARERRKSLGRSDISLDLGYEIVIFLLLFLFSCF